MIAVRMITVNNTIHPESPLFKVQQCGSQDTTTTGAYSYHAMFILLQLPSFK